MEGIIFAAINLKEGNKTLIFFFTRIKQHNFINLLELIPFLTLDTSQRKFFLKICHEVFSGAPNVNFRKISVSKAILDVEFSEHLLYKGPFIFYGVGGAGGIW